MKSSRVLSVLLIVFLAGTVLAESDAGPGPHSDKIGELTILTPDLRVDGPGELTLAYTAGPDGLPEKWKLWIELPPGWSNVDGCSKMGLGVQWQNRSPEKDGYFKVTRTPPGVKLKIETAPRTDIYLVPHRFSQVLSLQVRGRGLAGGETIEMVFRHHLAGGEARPPVTAGSGNIRWTLAPPDEKLPGNAPMLAELAPNEPRSGNTGSVWLEVAPGPPDKILVTLPALSKAGEPVRLRVRLLDRWFNLIRKWPDAVMLSGSGLRGLPESINPGPDGVGEVTGTPAAPGIMRVTATLPGLAPESSNPMKVSGDEPAMKIFWGDLHSHSSISHDGMGEQPFSYARDASALDFYALTDHNNAITDREWEDVISMAGRFNQPGSFVTLLAFENSAFSPSGHFNLFFKQDRAPLTFMKQLDEVGPDYADLDPLVINHHSGIMWTSTLPRSFDPLVRLFNKTYGPVVYWDKYSEVRRDAVEIYSLHGQSEFYDPSDPLSYENCDMVLPGRDDKNFGRCNTGLSAEGPHYARDGWAAGLVMGTVSGSDDHHAQPGKRGGGLTAVFAPALSRDDIFTAIRERRTYATTGDRVIMDFRINGEPMGSVIEPADKLHIEAFVAGTAPLAMLQVMQYDPGEKSWTAIIAMQPDADTAVVDRVVDGSGPAIYYLRIEEQVLVSGRPVRAWSSPIWAGMPRRGEGG